MGVAEADSMETNQALENVTQECSHVPELDESAKAVSEEHDQTLEAKIKEAEKLIEKMDREQLQVVGELKERMCSRDYLLSELRNLDYHAKYSRQSVNFASVQMNQLKVALDKLSFTNHAYQGREIDPGLLEEPPNIHRLHSRMIHGTKNLSQEKALLRQVDAMQRKGAAGSGTSLKDIDSRISSLNYRMMGCCSYDEETNSQFLNELKQAECDREKAIADAPVKGKIWNSLGSKVAIQDGIKEIDNNVDAFRKQQLKVRDRIKHVKIKLAAIEKDISELQKLNAEKYKRKDEAHECLFQL